MRRLLLALPLLVAACATTPAEPPPATVASVDLARYAGTWHEIARFPNSFQDRPGRECAGTAATCTARPDGTIGLESCCCEPRGEKMVATANAYAMEVSGKSKLLATFL